MHSAGQLDGAHVFKQIILGNNLTNHAISMLRSQSTALHLSRMIWEMWNWELLVKEVAKPIVQLVPWNRVLIIKHRSNFVIDKLSSQFSDLWPVNRGGP